MNTYDTGIKMPNYSPMWLTSELSLPRDRATINAWARSLYALEPDVKRIIDQHALLISNSYKLVEGRSNRANKLCENQMETLSIQSLIEKIIQEYFVLGETFLYAELNESKGLWSRIMIQNPDYIMVKNSIAGEKQYFLRPDENIRRICFSNRPEDISVRNHLNQSIVDNVKNGQNIPLDTFYLWNIMNKVSPYDMRGTSFIMPLFKIMSSDTAADDKSLAIKKYLGDITSSDKKNIAKDILLARYSMIINQLEYWINEKLLAPIAKLNDMGKENKKILLFPRVKFDRAQLKKSIGKV